MHAQLVYANLHACTAVVSHGQTLFE